MRPVLKLVPLGWNAFGSVTCLSAAEGIALRGELATGCRNGRMSVRPVGPARLTRRCLARVRADASSTRYKISSNLSNDQPGMADLGRIAVDGVMSPERPDRRRRLDGRKERIEHSIYKECGESESSWPRGSSCWRVFPALSYSSTATRPEYAAGRTTLQSTVIDREVGLKSWRTFFGFF
jgi:hypothetical protein